MLITVIVFIRVFKAMSIWRMKNGADPNGGWMTLFAHPNRPHIFMAEKIN
jgi:hypothetical protein